MTNLPGQIQQRVGNTFGLRTWIEYGFKHAKDDLGWADYRVTEYASIERWWELVMSAYTLVSLQSADVAALGHLARSPPRPLAPPRSRTPPLRSKPIPPGIRVSGWKHHLNNLRLLLQPYVCSCLLLPWLRLGRRSHTCRPFRPASPRWAHSSTPSAWRSQHDRMREAIPTATGRDEAR